MIDFKQKLLKAITISLFLTPSVFALTVENLQVSCDKKECNLDLKYDLNGKKLPGYYQKVTGKKVIVAFANSNFSEELLPMNTIGSGIFQNYKTKTVNDSKGNEIFQIHLALNSSKAVKGKLSKQKGNVLRFSWNNTAKKSSKWDLLALSKKVQKDQKLKESKKPTVKKPSSKKVGTKEKAPMPSSKSTGVVIPKKVSKSTNSLESFVKQKKSSGSVTSSKTFTLKSVSRNVFVTADKVSLFEKANKKAKKLKILPFGTDLVRLDVVGEYYKVKLSRETGYVLRSEVAYDDELTKEQKNQLIELTREMIQKRKNTQLADTNVVVKEVTAAWKNKDRLHYSSFGRRDPFIPLENVEVDGISIDEIRLVGIIWDKVSPLVILEDVRAEGVSYTLREGDPIINGKIYKINPQEVIFQVTEFGVTRNFSIPLPQSEDKE